MNFLQRIKDGAGRASERAQSAVEIGRLNSHISDIQREIDVHLLRMGQVFYEHYRNPDTAPAEEEIMELCTACDLLNEEIVELRMRIAELRSERLCECGARLDLDAESCPHCGRHFTAGGEQASAAVSAASGEHVVPAVKLSKPLQPEQQVEAEKVHDLVDEPGFERRKEPLRVEDSQAHPAIAEVGEGDFEEGFEEEARLYEREVVRERPDFESAEEVEDEQFATKRYELGTGEAETAAHEPHRYDEFASMPDDAEPKGRNPEEETPEEREERQRRELREIRSRERRKMKEEQQRQREREEGAVRPSAAADARYEEEETEPAHDPEYERRQRERIEREQERQDELDRLIASWNGGISRGDEDDKFIIRRPVGEVVRCQVCGSGLPKGSKWCPHCASEQI